MTLTERYLLYFEKIFNAEKLPVLIIHANDTIAFANKSFLEASDMRLSQLKRKKTSEVWNDLNLSVYLRKLKNPTALYTMLNFDNGKKNLQQHVFIHGLYDDKKLIAATLVFQNQLKENNKVEEGMLENVLLKALSSREETIWFITDILKGENLFTSDAAKSLIGWEPKFFVSGGWTFFFSLLHPDDYPVISEKYIEWLSQKNLHHQLYEHIVFQQKIRIRPLKGDYLNFEMKTNVLERDPSGLVRLILGTFQLYDVNMDGLIADRYLKLIDGKPYLSLEYLKNFKKNLNGHQPSQLSGREQEVMKMIIDGHSSDQIATLLGISKHTVNMHRKQSLKKLKARNIAEAIRLYLSGNH